mmetsp:Transcript_53683/g.152982  ORF Transcript_53683/g.152982 Transcript_53683/m.152982 type:complete len:206 (+) Transcript_53683:934-1551(+)
MAATLARNPGSVTASSRAQRSVGCSCRRRCQHSTTQTAALLSTSVANVLSLPGPVVNPTQQRPLPVRALRGRRMTGCLIVTCAAAAASTRPQGVCRHSRASSRRKVVAMGALVRIATGCTNAKRSATSVGASDGSRMQTAQRSSRIAIKLAKNCGPGAKAIATILSPGSRPCWVSCGALCCRLLTATSSFRKATCKHKAMRKVCE